MKTLKASKYTKKWIKIDMKVISKNKLVHIPTESVYVVRADVHDLYYFTLRYLTLLCLG